MSVLTHCLPSGSLGTNEIPVSSVDDGSVAAYIPSGGLGHGNIRGVIVSMHGLSVGVMTIPTKISNTNLTSFAFTDYGPQFRDSIVADGWIDLSVSYPEDFYVGYGSQAIWNDANSDSGFGARYLQTQLHWWDHVVEYIQLKFGNLPIVAFGGSWGGWHTLQVAAHRQSTLVGYISHVPATILSNASPAFTTPVNYGPTAVTVNGMSRTPLLNGTSGLDIGVHHLDAVTIPGVVGYGTNDEAVGWQTTASLPGIGPINSNTDAMLTNAASAGSPVTRYSTNSYHEFRSDQATYYSDTWIPANLDTLCPKLF